MTSKLKTITKNFVCYECFPQPTFTSHEARVEHLKTCHQKWWLEYSCRDGKDCPGFISGKCGFNHFNVGVQSFNIHRKSSGEDTTFQPSEKRYISDISDISENVCADDKPWENTRCSARECSKDHFWGRVRFLKKTKHIHRQKAVESPAFIEESEADIEEPATAIEESVDADFVIENPILDNDRLATDTQNTMKVECKLMTYYLEKIHIALAEDKYKEAIPYIIDFMDCYQCVKKLEYIGSLVKSKKAAAINEIVKHAEELNHEMIMIREKFCK